MGEFLIVFYLGQGLIFDENINVQKLNFFRLTYGGRGFENLKITLETPFALKRD